MKQSRLDSIMEVVTSTAVGFVVSLVVWHFVALAYGIPMPMAENLQITAIFTVASLARSYLIRRVFNGRSIWQAIKAGGLGNRIFGYNHPGDAPPEGTLLKGH